ncbi:hypothetical protein LINGRAHAP2_LOCUS13907 [Linum grandiflorum]
MRFFVKIPVERNSDGWPALLRLLGSFAQEERQAVGVDNRSFVDVIRSKILSTEGECRVVIMGGVKSVKVERVGVAAMEEYLGSCLLHGKADVARVLRLGRWRFGERNIKAGDCFSFAGRSNVAAEKGVVWLRMDGIPLHLRSFALFKQLGNCCGRFLDFKEDGCSLNSIRIKVGEVAAIPRQIPIFLDDECYLIYVLVENSWKFKEGWRVRSTEVYVRAQIPVPASAVPEADGQNSVGGEREAEDGFDRGTLQILQLGVRDQREE